MIDKQAALKAILVSSPIIYIVVLVAKVMTTTMFIDSAGGINYIFSLSQLCSLQGAWFLSIGLLLYFGLKKVKSSAPARG